jgi:hypothetical protein
MRLFEEEEDEIDDWGAAGWTRTKTSGFEV